MIRSALASPGGTCYRHCDGPIRARTVRSRLPGTWTVRACPAGVVSVASYAEWTRHDPTPRVLRQLKRWTVPASLVRAWDLRPASRHGPELGRSAERFLGSARPATPVRLVYWRVYPHRAKDGTERRLFVCLRAIHPGPVFFTADPAAGAAGCPVCAAGRRRSRKRPA